MTNELASIKGLDRYQLRFLQREGERRDLINLANSIGGTIANNPMFSLLAVYIIVEALQQAKWMPNMAGTAVEGVCAGSTMVNAVAKSGIIQQLVTAGQETAKTTTGIVKDVLPLLLASGAVL